MKNLTKKKGKNRKPDVDSKMQNEIDGATIIEVSTSSK